MDAARHARVKEVFFAVQPLPPGDWAAALERECAGDDALRKEVESLLGYHRPESLIEPPIQPGARIAQVTFDRGATAKWNEEQRAFLAQRVRFLALILQLTAVVVGVRAFALFGVFTKLSPGAASGMLAGWVGLCLFTAVLFILRTPSVEALRRIEVGLMASASILVFCWSYGWLISGVMLREPPSRELALLLQKVLWVGTPGGGTHFQIGSSFISLIAANQWSLLVGIYGFFIPNTIRRGILAVVVFVLASIGAIVAAAMTNPTLWPIVLELIVSSTFIIVTFGVLGMYVCQKFQSLRRAIFDAKQVGQYRLLKQLGKGAMGEVYLAQHRLLHRPCAVKLIRPEQAGSEDWLLRFEREVQAMAQLTHPNTVEVYDFGRTEDDSFFYAMEYLPGKTLDALVRSHGALPAGRVIYFLRQLCGALAEAHDKGLVHRDIKPGTIIVCERGGMQDVVKLLDFGLVHVQTEAVLTTEETSVLGRSSGSLNELANRSEKIKNDEKGVSVRLTMAGQLLGTPAYMSPEQVRQKQADVRSDIYSLGGVACFLLTARPPFESDSLEVLFAAHLHTPPPSVRERDPSISQEIDAIVARCLQKDPDLRFQRVSELSAALAATSEANEWDSTKADVWWRTQGGLGETIEALAVNPAELLDDAPPDVMARTLKSQRSID